MSDSETTDIAKALLRAERICRTIRTVLTVFMILFIAAWVLSLLALVYAHGANAGELFGEARYLLLYGVLIIVILWNMMKVFSSVVAGQPPFSEAQADRLRIIAIAGLLFVIAELVFTGIVNQKVISEIGFAMDINGENTEPILNINIGMLVFSAIMYSLSAIFRYAALLQQLSDETV